MCMDVLDQQECRMAVNAIALSRPPQSLQRWPREKSEAIRTFVDEFLPLASGILGHKLFE